MPRAMESAQGVARERIGAVVEALVSRHAAAACSEEARGWGTVEALATRVRRAAEHATDPRARTAAEALGHALQTHGDAFRTRVLRDHVRAGCGALRWRDVRLEADGAVHLAPGDPPRCPASDVCADLAGLHLDLREHGEPAVAERLLADYAEASDDYGFYPLLDFYLGLRALEETGAPAPERRPVAPPALVVTAGLVGCGKSTVARQVAQLGAMPRIAADAVRASLLTSPPAEPPLGGEWERSCEPGFADAVYAELFRRAGQVLASGRGVVLDGCFRSRAQRATAQELAREHELPFLLFECRLHRGRLRERLRARDRVAGRKPGTWTEILRAMEDEWEPISDLPAGAHVVIDTAEAEAATHRRVEESWRRVL